MKLNYLFRELCDWVIHRSNLAQAPPNSLQIVICSYMKNECQSTQPVIQNHPCCNSGVIIIARCMYRGTWDSRWLRPMVSVVLVRSEFYCLSIPSCLWQYQNKMPKEGETPPLSETSPSWWFLVSLGHPVNSAETTGTGCVGVVIKLRLEKRVLERDLVLGSSWVSATGQVCLNMAKINRRKTWVICRD